MAIRKIRNIRFFGDMTCYKPGEWIKFQVPGEMNDESTTITLGGAKEATLSLNDVAVEYEPKDVMPQYLSTGECSYYCPHRMDAVAKFPDFKQTQGADGAAAIILSYCSKYKKLIAHAIHHCPYYIEKIQAENALLKATRRSNEST
jgi:hypothetical protein